MTIIDDDPRIRARQPSMRKSQSQEASYEGPPLRRCAGRFRFKDRMVTPLKTNNSKSSQNVQRYSASQHNQRLVSSSQHPTSTAGQDVASETSMVRSSVYEH